MAVTDFDDFVLWVTLGVILGGRIGYVLFYNPVYFAAHPLEIVAALEGRHVVPRRLPRLRARGRAVRAPPRHPDPVARRHHLRGRRRSACSSAGIANFINGELWGRPPTSPGRWCFPAAGRCRAIRASFTRRRWKGWCCSSCLPADARGRVEAAGLDRRDLRSRLRDRTRRSANCSANPMRSSASCGAGLRWACCCRCR